MTLTIMITIDTREKDISHILDFFRQNNIEFCRKKLDVGDYSGDGTIIIERKRVGEIAVNLTGQKLRFKNEFKRNKSAKIIVMIEGSLDDIKNNNYRSNISPKDFIDRLKTWSNHFMLQVEFVEKEDAGKFIFEKLGGIR
jgi:ERCC4-type nuclease